MKPNEHCSKQGDVTKKGDLRCREVPLSWLSIDGRYLASLPYFL
jgi:hypothetical protein